MPDVQVCAADNEEASAATVACARCVLGRVEPDHLSVSESYSRKFAFAATVEIIGPAKQADSVHKVHGHLALAGSYLNNRPEAKQNLETFLECIPHPRRWQVFD